MLTFKFVILAKMGIDGQDYYAAAVWLYVHLQKVTAVINPKWPLLLLGFNKSNTLRKGSLTEGHFFSLTQGFFYFCTQRERYCGHSICKGIARIEEFMHLHNCIVP